MLEITERAATVIADACTAQDLSKAGGLRIAPKTTVNDGAVSSLAVEFVDRPQPTDTVLRAGLATVFLADGLERLVGTRVLDAERSGLPPQLVLRARKPPTGEPS